MSDKIKILVVEPMKPCEVREIPDTLDAMRQIVGGDIEAQATNIRLRRLNQKYKAFSKAAGLPEQRERMKVLYP